MGARAIAAEERETACEPVAAPERVCGSGWASARVRSPSPALMLALQRSAGNRATRTLARRVPGDITITQITDEWARELTDSELQDQYHIVQRQLTSSATDDAAREVAESNLHVLETQIARGAGHGPAPTGATASASGPRVTAEPAGVPRPAGLPLDGGFRLVQITDAPAPFVQSLPEGQVVTVPASEVQAAAGVRGRSSGVQAVEDLGIAGGVGVRASSAWYQTYGYAAAGSDSVGLVAVPRSGPYLGHTAVVVRQGGRIVTVRGFNPDMRTPGGLLDLARTHAEMEAGTARVGSRLTSDASMFGSGSARSVEWPLSPGEASEFLGTLPDTGPGGRPGVPEFYTARPAVYDAAHPGQVCTSQNCGLWAVEQIEQGVGGTVGRPGQPSITSVGRGGATVPGTAHQPEIMSMLESGEVAPLAGRAPTVGAMSRNMRYLRIGGRVFLVVGVAIAVAEVATAAPERRARTAVSVGGGFVGGFALGATAGLFCGPGAPVCSIVAGLTLGLIGSVGGSAIAEGIYDSANAPAGPSSSAPQYPGHSVVCPSCHDLGPSSHHAAPAPFSLRSSFPVREEDERLIRQWLETQPRSQPAAP